MHVARCNTKPDCNKILNEIETSFNEGDLTEVVKLADSITNPQDDPVTTVRKIYMWFKENIPWTGALEYSIMPDIPGYVISNRRGDCGMQTLLFMSMLRYKGIPVRLQSGWMVVPSNRHTFLIHFHLNNNFPDL
ncbi:MAG: hypothetical protein A2V64_09500 [Bacteroidetes bacterium RBG_13_43_22]|nr:MAG: hypothetical protein A2V64_09500 [Bacteroidetes bacterium RBG_13_43_22]